MQFCAVKAVVSIKARSSVHFVVNQCAVHGAGESVLKNTGLGYTVIRAGPLLEEPGGYKALIFDQVPSAIVILSYIEVQAAAAMTVVQFSSSPPIPVIDLPASQKPTWPVHCAL